MTAPRRASRCRHNCQSSLCGVSIANSADGSASDAVACHRVLQGNDRATCGCRRSFHVVGRLLVLEIVPCALHRREIEGTRATDLGPVCALRRLHHDLVAMYSWLALELRLSYSIFKPSKANFCLLPADAPCCHLQRSSMNLQGQEDCDGNSLHCTGGREAIR